MQMIVDFMLLAASAAAAIYCLVLSGKLKKPNDMRSGLGASIAAMSVTLEQTRKMLAEAKNAQREAEENLQTLINDAGKTAAELSDLVEAILDAADFAVDEITTCRDAAIGEIAALTDSQEKSASVERPRRHTVWAA
jgi:Mg2+/Co2+ transporter CorB